MQRKEKIVGIGVEGEERESNKDVSVKDVIR